MSDPLFTTTNTTQTTSTFGIKDVGDYASPTLVDIDGDGDYDVYIGNALGNLVFYRNIGTIFFPVYSLDSSLGIGGLGVSASPAFADIDGDGDLDLFVGNKNGDIQFLRNKGTVRAPSFANEAGNFGLASTGTFTAPALVDIDNDGDLDAFVAKSVGDPEFFLNVGDPTSPIFTLQPYNFGLTNASPNPNPTPGLGNYASITFADIDGDGDLDAMMGNTSGNTVFFRNNGDISSPNFTAELGNFGLGDVGASASPTFADLDGDGDLDALVGNRTGFSWYYLNGSPSNTSISETRDSTAVTEGGQTDTYSVVLNSQPSANVVVTLDTTTRQVTTSAATLIFTPANYNVPQFVTVTAVDDTVGEGFHTGVIKHTLSSLDARFNGNSGGNLIVTVGDNDLPFGDQAYTPLNSIAYGLNDVGEFANPALVDIDSDGDLDAFIGNDYGNTMFYRNTGSALSPHFVIDGNNFGLSKVGYRASPSLADIDGDGDFDAFVGTGNGTTLFFRNSGTATIPRFINEVSSFGLADVGNAANPAFADIDGDNDLDALVGNSDGDILFFRNNGGPTKASFIREPEAYTIPNVGLNASPTLADVDGDGDLDLIVGNAEGSTILVRNTGDLNVPAFVAETGSYGITTVGTYASPAFADINADGDLDAFIGNADGETQLFVNNDPPSFSHFLGDVASGNEDAWVEISFVNLQTQGDEMDVDGNITAFVIKELSTGSLKIGETEAAAKPWSTVTNDSVDGTHNAYWKAAANVSGNSLNAFTAVVRDNGDLQSPTAVQATVHVEPVNDAPTLTAFKDALASGQEEEEVVVSFADLQLKGNQADVDGTVDGFVIKEVSSGSLKIGDTPSTAQPWAAGANETVTAGKNLYWTPVANTSGSNVNAFTVLAKDNNGMLSAPPVQAAINVANVNDPPVLAVPTPIEYLDTVYDDANVAVSGKLSASDADSTTLAYSLEGGIESNGASSLANTYGVLTLIKATGDFSFTPNDGAIEPLTSNTPLTFKFTVSDGEFSNSQWLAVNLNQQGATESNGNDSLVGDAGKNTFDALAGNDIIDGRAGADTMKGGAGDDKYYVDNIGDTVIETANPDSGVDTVYSYLTYALGLNLENLSLMGTTPINATGNGLNNALVGNPGANMLDGGAGADSMRGGSGNDTYIFDSASDTATETSSLATEIDTVNTPVSYTLALNIENLTLTGTAAINGTGNTLNNILKGNTGNNTLNGFSGSDTMIGDAGNDIYIVDNLTDTVVESSNSLTEIDTVNSSITYTLGANLEKLTLTGSAAINATGNTLGNTLTGNSANNILTGGEGADTMVGGGGNDTYVVDNSGDIVTETSNVSTQIDSINSSVTFTLGLNQENLSLLGSAAINATGNTLNNTLMGNSGNNVLNGGTGADAMTGGLGNDTYTVDNLSDSVTETSSSLSEKDLVNSSVTYTLGTNLENLTLTGSLAINATGNTLNNTLTGNSAGNTLNGNTGADTMIGGLGNDTYTVDNSGDIVTESSNVAAEVDTVNSSVTYLLGNNLENLTLAGVAAINGMGNSLSNVLTGNSAANTLNGSTGADKMAGGLGNDTYFVDNALDTVTETSALGTETDTVNSSVSYVLGNNLENLILAGTSAINGTGNALNNTLTGNNLANILNGGGGLDTLVGNGGRDVFLLTSLAKDTIKDFSVVDDTIQLENSVFTKLTATGILNANYFKMGAPADSNDYISYSGGILFYDADGNGSAAATQIAVLGTNLALTNVDFVVI